MRFWMSGEIQEDVYDSYAAASRVVEMAVSGCIGAQDYGRGLIKWCFIPIIVPVDDPLYGEIAKYYPRKKEVEFRLKIDHATFLSGGNADHVRLIAESLLRSLMMMPEIGVKDVDVDRLTADVGQCLAGVEKKVETMAGWSELSALVESASERELERRVALSPASWRFVQACWPRGDFRVDEILRFFALMLPAFGLSTLYYRRGKPVELSAAALEKRFKTLAKRQTVSGYGADEDFFTVPPSQRGGNNVGFIVLTGAQPGGMAAQPGGQDIDVYSIHIGDTAKVPDRNYFRQSIEIFKPFEAYLSDSRNEDVLRFHRRRKAIPDRRKPAMIAGFHYLDKELVQSVGGIDHCLNAPAWRVSPFCSGVLFELTEGLFDNNNPEHRDVQRKVMEHLGMWKIPSII